MALGLALAGAILLPIFLPYAQTSNDLGVVRTTYELDNWSAQWSYFGKVLQSNWLYAKLLAPNMATSLGERQLFFGIVPSILAMLGLVWGRGRHRFYLRAAGTIRARHDLRSERTRAGHGRHHASPLRLLLRFPPRLQSPARTRPLRRAAGFLYLRASRLWACHAGAAFAPAREPTASSGKI